MPEFNQLRRAFFIFALLAVPVFAADAPRVYVTFEGASPATITPGRPADVELKFRVKEGFHVNSNQPKSELLIPTTLKLEPTTNLAAENITYPPGKDISFPFDPSEKLNVYSDNFTVKARMSATKAANSGNVTVHGQLRYQACNDNACFPPKNIPVQFDVQVVSQAKSARGTTTHPQVK